MRARRLATFGLLVLGFLSPAFTAHAQDTQDSRLIELSLEELGNIEVTSVSKQPEQVWKTPVAIYVITQDDIRRSGATSIPEILRLAPGVEVSRIDTDHWSIGVRGFGDQFSKSLLVLIDGRSIYTPLFAGMYWPAHDTLLEDVDRVEVIRGPGGTIWGANAVNGVINIITRSAADTHGTLVTASGGSIDWGTGAVRYGGRAGGSFDYRVYAKGVSRGPQFHPDGSDYDDLWMGQAGFRGDWNRHARDQFTLQGDISRGSHGQRVSVASFAPPAQLAVDGTLEAWGGNVLFNWRRDVSPTQGIRLQAYYDRTSWLATHFGESRNTFDVDFLHRLQIGRRHAVTWGGGARTSPSEFTQTVLTLDFQPRHLTDSVYSGFAQDEIQIVNERLWVTFGSKVEHNNYTGVEVQPSARILWMPRPTQTLWSSVTRAVRTPSRIERGVESTSFSPLAAAVPVFLQVTGNAGFTAEELVGYEAGYRALLAKRVYFDVAGFHNEHDKLGSFGIGAVTLAATPPPLHALVRVPYVNGVDGTSDGVEVAADWKVHALTQLKASYSLVEFDLANTPGSADVNAVARYEDSAPHHQVRVESHSSLRQAEIDLTYRYASDLPMRQIKAYHTADARFSWRLHGELELFVAGQNLLQSHHSEFSPLVGISRAVYAGFTWRNPPGPLP